MAKDRYQHFLFTKSTYIEELRCTLIELEHEICGAKVMHIQNEDPENLFCLSFQTFPESSNGAAHILEHTVLCGSKRFPVKDPFFAMNRRSLNTFMNALTGADFTCYPAASLVEKDFYNLLDVYLDAAFYPLLDIKSFWQEGHRLAITDPENIEKSPIEFQGIVFNEMKGTLASADTRLWNAMMRKLVPDLPYSFNFGGDPTEIPDLTHEELLAFHDKYYHPSHCLFFFYGNFPLEKHLDFIEDKVLKNAKKKPLLPAIPRQKRYQKPKRLLQSYPTTDQDLSNKTYVAFGWLTMEISNQEDLLALSLLDSILTDTDASLLRYELLQSGLCRQCQAFLDVDMSEIPYLIVCRGSEKEHADQLETILFDTLKKIIKDGIPRSLIDSSLHQLEINRTEINGDYGPFGLTLFMRSALAKQHGCPPENALRIHTLFDHIIEKIKDPAYLPSILKKYLVDNPHFVRLVFEPDPQLEEKEKSEEKDRLKAIKSRLSLADLKRIQQENEELKIYQEKMEQSIDCLPKITLKDVPKKPFDIPLHQEVMGKANLFHHPVFTNKFLYVDVLFDLPSLALEDIPFLHFYASTLCGVGTGKRDYKQQLEYLHAHTGGIGSGVAWHPQLENEDLLKPSFGIRGRCLLRNSSYLLQLIKDVLTSPRFDEKERIKEMLLQIFTSLQNRLSKHALGYAISETLSYFSPSSFIQEHMYGINYYRFIEKMASDVDQNLDDTLEKLSLFNKKLLHLSSPQIVVSTEKPDYEWLKKERFFGLDTLPSNPYQKWQDHFGIKTEKYHIGRPIPSTVAFTCFGFPTIRVDHPDAPLLSLATALLDHKVLHPKIREQGGAYGAGATYIPLQGLFHFYSYRDPRISETVKAFYESLKEIGKGNFTEQDLEEAKLTLLQHYDHPISPAYQAITAYSWQKDGKTLSYRQKIRDRIFTATHIDIKKAVQSHLVNQTSDGILVSYAGEDLLNTERAKLSEMGISMEIQPIS